MRGVAVKMTKPMLLALAQHHEWEAKEYRRILSMASCQNCNHWQHQQCDKFKAVPPPEVAKSGCDEYEFDDIPF